MSTFVVASQPPSGAGWSTTFCAVVLPPYMSVLLPVSIASAPSATARPTGLSRTISDQRQRLSSVPSNSSSGAVLAGQSVAWMFTVSVASRPPASRTVKRAV